MDPLRLPAFEAKIRNREDRKPEIWDPVRKKFVALTPEEWVRQHLLHFLIHHRGYPASLVGVEVPRRVNRLMKRSDIVAYDRLGKPVLLAECKAPNVPVTQDVFYQVAMYNSAFSGKYLVVSNGLDHYCAHIDQNKKSWRFVPDIPHYSDICDLKDDFT
jgi:hypothetical protein